MVVGVSSGCAQLHFRIETPKHCLWECIESQLIWQRLLRIFANYFSPLVITWGTLVWTSLVRYAFHYDVKSMDHEFYTKSGSARALPCCHYSFQG